MGNFRSTLPLGTTDIKVLLGNASNFDEAMHEKILRYWLDRFGRQRLTWHGIEELFQEFLINSGYQDMGEYASGLELTARNQMFHKDGELYRASAALVLPYTLTGDWAQEKDLFVAMGDQALRQQLTDESGSSIVGHGPATVADVLDRSITSVDSVASLRTLTPFLRSNPTPKVSVSCHTVDGDGGGGTFVWDPSSASQDDNGTIINGWRRVIDGPVYAEWFGARAFKPGVDEPSLFDSSDAFQAASDFVGAGGAWLWRGVHRITKTIKINRRQSFGSLGSVRSWNPGDMSNWQGPNTAQAQRLDNAVFFDPPEKEGVLFQCEEDARPHSFLAYSIGFNEIGLDATHSQPESKHYNVACFRYNKYLTHRDVSVHLFKTVFLSEGFDGEVGNYYSTYQNPEVSRCFEVFAFKSIQPFNQRLYNPKISVTSRLLDCEHGLSGMTIHGGSIEGWRQNSTIRGDGSLAIFGTYFETFNPDASGAVFYLNSRGNFFSFSYHGGVFYLNNTSGLFYTEKANTRVSSSGNTFIYGGSTSSTKYIYHYSATALGTSAGFAAGDTYVGVRGTWFYSNASLDFRIDPPGASTLDGFINCGQKAMRFVAYTEEPVNRVSGSLYLANGGSWNPLNRSGGYPYFVCYRNGWEAV